MSWTVRLFAIATCCLTLAATNTRLFCQDMAISDVLIENDAWTVVASGYRFTDGAATDREGNFYFADVAQGDAIYRISVDGAISKLPGKVERISGLQWGPDRRLYACQGGNPGKILAISSNGNVDVIATDVQPNDLVVTATGGIYFTETGKAQVTYIAPGGKPTLAAKGPLKPNGIALSPDQETLAVSDYEGENVWAWRIQKDGTLDAGHPYMTMRLAREDQPSHGDGMTTDAQGRFFVTTAAGLQIFDPTGRLSGVIATPQAQSMVSVEMSGPELAYLYVCNGDKIYRRKTKSHGNAPPGGQDNRSVAPLVSPEVTSERMVTYRLKADKAGTVRVVGGDLPQIGQGKDLQKNEQGVWELTVGPVDPGAYRYRFDVDGVTVADPINTNISESNGNFWNVAYVPGADWMDSSGIDHGAVSEVHYHSKALQRDRRMHVYTPPGYDASATEKYPVFYLLHGASDCDNSWSTVGRAGFILDNLIAEGKAKPMVVVMPAGHTRLFNWGQPLITNEFERDFMEAIKPYIETHYRVHRDRANTAIAGLSMGGGQSLQIGIPHLDQFGYIGVYSSGLFGITGRGPIQAQPGPSFEERHTAILDNAELKKDLKLFWFATGKDDFLVETSRATVAMFQKHGFQVEYHETDGGHTWIKWRDYLREFAPLLFQTSK